MHEIFPELLIVVVDFVYFLLRRLFFSYVIYTFSVHRVRVLVGRAIVLALGNDILDVPTQHWIAFGLSSLEYIVWCTIMLSKIIADVYHRINPEA